MSKRRQLDLEKMSAAQVAAELARLLEHAGASFGYGKARLWEEWLQYTAVCLEVTLRPFRDGTPHNDAPLREEEERLRKIFDAPHGNFDQLLTLFREAAVLWYSWSAYGIEDVLGLAYMNYMWANEAAGQFFTPWHVAVMMAQMSVQDGAREVFDRIKEAVERLREADPVMAIYADSLILTAFALGQGENPTKMIESILVNLLPLIQPYYQTIDVCDPCCGSGVMLLAASLQYPVFANRMGLVQYYGQDIDQTCIRMAHLNMMAYGLNGWGAAAVYFDLAEAGMPLPALARDDEDEAAEEGVTAAPDVQAKAATDPAQSREESPEWEQAIQTAVEEPLPAAPSALPSAPFVFRTPKSGKPRGRASDNQMAFGFLEEVMEEIQNG
jgi:hypothetical protein